ncbi:MAG TPA: protease inhibitor I42 family protein [Tepidisphaeraceae bacterium]|nr:protease inhibitor I42 family protein [Tepidisphaeraceae bacterium]
MKSPRLWAILGWLSLCGMMAGTEGCAGHKKVMPVYSDPQQVIMVAPGQRFEIRLPADRAAGMEWQMPYSSDGGYLRLVERKYPGGWGQAGTGGEQTWTFQAITPGNAFIPLEYVQAFERNLPVTKRATFKVSIH